MNTDTIAYTIVAVVLVAAIAISAAILMSPTNNTQQEDTTPLSQTKSTGSTGMGDALIELTPRGVENGEFIIDYSANTHSVSLSEYDLAQQTTLTYEGEEISASSATPMGGHHVQGTLTFALDEQPTDFSVTITGVPGVEQRVYTWEGMQ